MSVVPSLGKRLEKGELPVWAAKGRSSCQCENPKGAEAARGWVGPQWEERQGLGQLIPVWDFRWRDLSGLRLRFRSRPHRRPRPLVSGPPPHYQRTGSAKKRSRFGDAFWVKRSLFLPPVL